MTLSSPGLRGAAMGNFTYTLHRKAGFGDLSRPEVDELAECYGRFVECPRAAFEHSLALADDIVVVRDGGMGVRGFGALRSLPAGKGETGRDAIYFLYMDLDPPFRSRAIVQQILLMCALPRTLRHILRPPVVVCSASTFLSYLWITHNLATYWPRRDRATPPAMSEVADVAVRRLGIAGWDPATGVIRRRGLLRYREGLLRRSDPLPEDLDIRFYAERNPGQEDGDTLVCVFPLDVANLIRLGWAVARASLAARSGGSSS